MIKYVVSAFAFAICVYLVKDLHMGVAKYDRMLSVGVNLKNLAQPIDPMNNPTLSNAFFSNNLYSNLVEVDDKNSYRPDLASNLWFDTDQKKLFFEFKNSRITADDAEFSLKRVILQNSQLHSDLWEIICAEGENRQKCASRIYVQDGKLVINYANEDRSNYIIPTLASVDYKIVPIAGFDDLDPAIAKVIDLTKTSGHYYLEKQNDTYIFRKNQSSNLEIYKNFKIVDVSKPTSASVEGLDIISTTVPLEKDLHQQLTSEGWHHFGSYNISIVFIIFSKNGINKTTSSQRFKLANIFASEILKFQPYDSLQTVEIFQEFGQGYLSDEQKVEITSLRNQEFSEKLPEVVIGTKAPQMLAKFVEDNKSFKLKKLDTLAVNLAEKDQPDLFTMSNDLSFDLNLSFITFAAKVGILKMESSEITEFLNLKTNEDKVKFINNVHYRTLKDCVVYPVWTVPYYTYFNGDFDVKLSKFNSRTLLWKIH